MDKNIKVAEEIAKTIGMPVERLSTIMAQLHRLSDIDRELFIVLAALSEKDRKMVIDYYKPLWGAEYATDVAKDYLVRGKTQKVEASNGNKIQKEAALSSKDSNMEKSYWTPLYGAEYAGDMVENYKGGGEMQQVEASYSAVVKQAESILGKETVEALRKLPREAALSMLDSLSSKKK